MTPRTFLDGPSNSVSVSLLLLFELRTVAAVGGGRERSTEGNTATGKEGMRQRCRSLARPFADCSRPTDRPTDQLRSEQRCAALPLPPPPPSQEKPAFAFACRVCSHACLSASGAATDLQGAPVLGERVSMSGRWRALGKDRHKGQPRRRLDGEPKE